MTDRTPPKSAGSTWNRRISRSGISSYCGKARYSPAAAIYAPEASSVSRIFMPAGGKLSSSPYTSSKRPLPTCAVASASCHPLSPSCSRTAVKSPSHSSENADAPGPVSVMLPLGSAFPSGNPTDATRAVCRRRAAQAGSALPTPSVPCPQRSLRGTNSPKVWGPKRKYGLPRRCNNYQFFGFFQAIA